MIRPLEDQLRDVLGEIGDYSAPDDKPRTLDDYDGGIATAEILAELTGRAARLALELARRRTSERNDFILALHERQLPPDDLHGVNNRTFL